jgi:hypothetical protein
MRFFIGSDIEEGSGLDELMDNAVVQRLQDFFSLRDYGPGLQGISIFLRCRDPLLKFNRRAQVSKKDKKLYLDMRLDSEAIKNYPREAKQQLILERMGKEISVVLHSAKAECFDRDRLLEDLKICLAELSSPAVQ